MSAERETARAFGRCVVHPERPPVGRCRTCSTPVCPECHVRLDGILHCRACLTRVARDLAPRRRSQLPRVATLVVALAVFVPSVLGVRVLLRGGGLVAGRMSRWFSPADPSDGGGEK